MNKIWEKPTNVGTGRACAPYASDNAACTQPADCAPKGSTTLNVSTISMKGLKAGQNAGGATRAGHNDSGSTTCAPEVCTTSNVSTMPSAKKKSRKMLRFFTAAGLALFMGIGTLCGVLIAPMGTSAASANSQAGVSASQNASGAATKAAHDAAILSGGDLGLDPENDPVVYTTDYGLDIKFHNAFTAYDDAGESSYKGSTGFIYFTMGAYKDTPVNWIIIGRASDVTFSDRYIYDGIYSLFGKTFEKEYVTHTVSDYPNWPTVSAEYYKNNPQETTTPAGATISAEIAEDLIRDYRSFWVTNLPVVNDNELDSGEILCLSEKNICSSQFRTSTSSNNYSGSTLQTTINTLYSSGLGLTDAQQSAIQAQRLSVYYTGTTTVYSQSMFPLAGRGENFNYDTYLTQAQRDIDAVWWLRSGTASNSYGAYYVFTNGGLGGTYDASVDCSYGVRPAFVLSLG